MFKIIIFILLIGSSLNLSAQVGCRRNSDGMLFQNRIFLSSDYNANDPAGSAAKFCLPPGTSGSNCTIRIPFTMTSYSGVYGNYSAVNCGLDEPVYVMMITATLVFLWVRKKNNEV